jgi:hypothetical protein
MPDDSVQLLTSLDSAVREHISPHHLAQGASHSSGLSGFDGYPGLCTLKAKPFTSVAGSFFWWVHRFSTDACVMDIGFGDREFIVETTVFYPAINARFAPWELLLADEVADPQAISGNAWVLTEDFMERTVLSIGSGIRKYWPRLSQPEPVIVDRARELRGRRLIFAQEEQRKRDRERAAIKASRAFHESRYEEAIKLLTPYQNDEGLSRSAQMLLHVAQKRKQLG